MVLEARRTQPTINSSTALLQEAVAALDRFEDQPEPESCLVRRLAQLTSVLEHHLTHIANHVTENELA